MEYATSPSPMPLLAYLAGEASTDSTGGRHDHRRRPSHPIRVAGECALLDVIEQRRTEVGLARGAYSSSSSTGWPGAWSRPMVASICASWCRVRELWQGDYAHDGEIWQFPT